jgi:hypothetical protein
MIGGEAAVVPSSDHAVRRLAARADGIVLVE